MLLIERAKFLFVLPVELVQFLLQLVNLKREFLRVLFAVPFCPRSRLNRSYGGGAAYCNDAHPQSRNCLATGQELV